MSINSFIESIRRWFRRSKPEMKEGDVRAVAAGMDRTRPLNSPSSPDQLKEGAVENLSADGRPRRRRTQRKRKERSNPERRLAPAGQTLRQPAFPAEPWDASEFKVPATEGKLRFHDLDLPEELMHGIYDLSFQYCTPIQETLLPEILKGKDAAGQAQTGTGKSAVFLITILTHLYRNPAPSNRPKGKPRALILAPTRELALQVVKDARLLAKYIPCHIIAIFGGMGYEKQRQQLAQRPVDIMVATPGRLIDFMRDREIRLDSVEVLVIDEADRMLDMGFIPDVQKIVHSTPTKSNRQTLFFSATMSPEVTRLSAQWTRDPIMVEIHPERVAVDTVDQVVYITTAEEKFPLLYNMITGQNLDRVIVFTNRRDQARKLTDLFMTHNISSALLSGEVAQNRRIKTLEDFRGGKIRVLVATDVAARGLHIEGVSHVVNFNLPHDPEDYVHRIGRTGRAGASGISVSFACEEDAFQIPALEKFLGHEIRCEHPTEELLKETPPPEVQASPKTSRKRSPSSRPRRSSAARSRRSDSSKEKEPSSA